MNDRDLRDHTSSDMIATDDINVSVFVFDDILRSFTYDFMRNSHPQASQPMR